MRRLIVVTAGPAVFAALLLAAGLTACGGSTPKPKLAFEPQPVWCPSALSAFASNKPGTTRRMRGSFDARALLGKREAAARQISTRHGCGLRVINAGGALTADWTLRRVDVRVEHGVVTSVQVY